MVMRVFVFEYLTGCDDDGASAELLAQGLAMRDAVVQDLLAAAGIEVGCAAAPGQRAAPLPAATLRPHPGEGACEFVARQALRHDLTWVIAPESGGVLAALQRAVDRDRWLGCDGATIAVASWKAATLDLLAAAGIATPRAFEHDPHVRRWVVKPDDGAGSVDTQVHDSRDAAYADRARRRAAGASATLEPWIEGDPLSLTLRCDASGVELLSVNRQRFEIDPLGMLSFHGVTTHVLPPHDARLPALERLAERVQAALPGLRGIAGIDLVWHPHAGPVTIEINPRTTSAYVGLSHALGRNLAAEVVAAHLEETARCPIVT
ncbi:MAG: ATP-grasp domain-containing protein [Proteobacteria bacterium]|nr:ATP-grasp domain-containing protein [Pseudomonadota bacterium]